MLEASEQQWYWYGVRSTEYGLQNNSFFYFLGHEKWQVKKNRKKCAWKIII